MRRHGVFVPDIRFECDVAVQVDVARDGEGFHARYIVYGHGIPDFYVAVLHGCVGDAASVVAYFEKRGILALSDIHRPDCDVGGLRFFPCRAQNYATVGCAGRAGVSESSYVPGRVLCRAKKFNTGGRARLMKAVARPVSRLRCVVVYYGDGCYVQEGGFYSVDDTARFPRYRQVCAVVEVQQAAAVMHGKNVTGGSGIQLENFLFGIK